MDLFFLHLWRFILLIIFLLAAYGAGSGAFKIARIDRKNTIKTFFPLLSITLGLGILSYLTLIIGLMALLYEGILWGMLILFGFIGIFIIKEEQYFSYKLDFRKIIDTIYRLDIFSKIFLIIFILLVFLNFIGALAPPLNIDDLKYHFAMPKRYINSAEINYISDIGFSNFPFPIEMLWTLAIGVNSGELAQLLNWAFGCIVILWIFALGSKAGLGIQELIISVVLFYSITNVGHQSRSGNVELSSCIFFLCGLFLLLEDKESRNRILIIISGILFGIFAVVKLSNAAMVILISFWLALSDFRIKRAFLSSLGSATIFAFFSLLLAGVWYIKTYTMTGNPLYPFFQSYLGGPEINNELLSWGKKEIDSASKSFQHLSAIPETYLTQLWKIIANPQKLRGHISPLFLSSIPILILNWCRLNYYIKRILILGLLYYIYWVAFYPMIRIALPLFALLSIPISIAIYRFHPKENYIKVILNILLTSFLIISLGGNLKAVIPRVPVIIGTQPDFEYINSYGRNRYEIDSYLALDYMNKNLPKNSKILLWSNNGYYLNHDYLYALGFITNIADSDKIYNPSFVINELKRHGITHVAMTENYLRKRLKNTLLSSNEISIVYYDNDMIVASI